MPFSSIPSRTNGQTIDQTWFNLLQAAGAVLESEYNALRTSFIIALGANGAYDQAANVMTGFEYFIVPQATTLQSAKLINFKDSGGGGNLEIDVYRKSGAGAFTSIFTTKPKVHMTGSDWNTSDSGGSSVSAVLSSPQSSLVAGDILRLDITIMPTMGAGINMTGFMLQLFHIPTGA